MAQGHFFLNKKNFRHKKVIDSIKNIYVSTAQLKKEVLELNLSIYHLLIHLPL